MERIDLGTREHTVQREFRFAGGAIVKVGTVGNLWFAWHSRKGHAWAFQYERAMADLADKWLAHRGWVEVTPSPGAAASGDQPVRPAGRRRRVPVRDMPS